MKKYLFEYRFNIFDLMLFVVLALFGQNMHWMSVLITMISGAAFSSSMNRKLRRKTDPWSRRR